MGIKLETEHRLARAIRRVLERHAGKANSGLSAEEEFEELDAACKMWKKAGAAK